MLNLNTSFLPLAEKPVPPITAREAAPVVVLENPTPAFTVAPENALSSFPEVAVIQVLDPFEPFR
jgi:hypothetical protein